MILRKPGDHHELWYVNRSHRKPFFTSDSEMKNGFFLVVGKGFQKLEGDVSFTPDNDHQTENHLAGNGYLGVLGFI